MVNIPNPGKCYETWYPFKWLDLIFNYKLVPGSWKEIRHVIWENLGILDLHGTIKIRYYKLHLIDKSLIDMKSYNLLAHITKNRGWCDSFHIEGYKHILIFKEIINSIFILRIRVDHRIIIIAPNFAFPIL